MLTKTAAGYDFLAGADPYSDGVVAQEGFEIIHATLATPLPWRRGFELVEQTLESHSRRMNALCAIELRSPQVRSFDGFAEFNAGYHQVLEDYELLIGARNPIARTNVVPDPGPPEEVVMYAFSFTVQSPTGVRSFVSSGAGELVNDALSDEAIVAKGDTTPAGLRSKATHVMATMSSRLQRLGVGWDDVTTTNVYMVVSPGDAVENVVLPQLGAAATRGIHWLSLIHI